MANPNPNGIVYKREGSSRFIAWNQLIRDVNEILENPPEDTDCDPLPPIDEVGPDHIWTIADVEEVQDALKETCPDIDFPNELKYWLQEVIDDIDNAMEQAWCDCEPDEECAPVEVVLEGETCGWQLVLASPHSDKCCGMVIESAPCEICIGQHCCETLYNGDYFSCDYVAVNDVYYDIITATYDVAWDAYLNYCIAVTLCSYYACRIRMYQRQLDDIVDEIDSLIAQWESAGCDGTTPPPQCATICAEMRDLGSQAQDKQADVDEEVVLFAAEHAKIEPAETTCNVQAAQNMAAAMSIQAGRFPGVDVNQAAELLSKVSNANYSWGKWFNPNTDNQIAYNKALLSGVADSFCSTIADTHAPCVFFSQGYLNADDDWGVGVHSGGGIRPYVVAKYTKTTGWPGRVYIFGAIQVSPDGTPFIEHGTAKRMQQDFSLAYYTRQVRWRCERIISDPRCPAPPPMWCYGEVSGECTEHCEFPPFGDTDNWYWSQSGSSTACGGWLWEPLPPWKPEKKGTVSPFAVARYISNKLGKDYTDEQQEFYDTYLDWYDGHSKYDDRHEDYCPS